MFPGGVHRDLAGDVEQVRDQHVQGRAGGVVEPGTLGDVEVLGHVDLHLLHSARVPLRPEEPVREAQRIDGLHRLLAEEVVDAEDLLLGEHLLHQGVERLEVGQRGAVGLLVHHAGARGQPVASQPAGDGGVRRGRYGQEVHHQRLAATLVAQLAVRPRQDLRQCSGVVLGEPTPRVAHPACDLGPVLGQTLLAAQEGVLQPGPERLVVPPVRGAADQAPPLGQQTTLVQPHQGRHHHAAGQIASGAEQHNDDGRGRGGDDGAHSGSLGRRPLRATTTQM